MPGPQCQLRTQRQRHCATLVIPHIHPLKPVSRENMSELQMGRLRQETGVQGENQAKRPPSGHVPPGWAGSSSRL